MKLVRCLAVSISLFNTINAHGQLSLDAQHIRKAQEALAERGTCAQALTYLRLVSDAGKGARDYLLTTARAHDCLANTEQALYYYRKVSEIEPNNDSVKLRVAEISDLNSKKTIVRKQELLAKNLYKSAKRGGNGMCMNDREFIWGFGAAAFTSTDRSPFKRSFNFFNASDFPFLKNRAMFEFKESIGYLSGGRKPWFAHVFGVPDSAVTRMPGTFNCDMNVSLAGLLINKYNLAVSAGPMFGFTFYAMPGVEIVSASNSYSHPFLFTATWGLRSNVYIGEHLVVSGAFVKAFRSTYNNDLNYGIITSTPFSGNSMEVSVGLRNLDYWTHTGLK